MKFTNFVIKDIKPYLDETWTDLSIGKYRLVNGDPATITTVDGTFPIIEIKATRQGIGRGSLSVAFDETAPIEDAVAEEPVEEAIAEEPIEEAPIEEKTEVPESIVDSIIAEIKAKLKLTPEAIEETPVVEPTLVAPAPVEEPVEEVAPIEEEPIEEVPVEEEAPAVPEDKVITIPLGDGSHLEIRHYYA